MIFAKFLVYFEIDSENCESAPIKQTYLVNASNFEQARDKVLDLFPTAHHFENRTII